MVGEVTEIIFQSRIYGMGMLDKAGKILTVHGSPIDNSLVEDILDEFVVDILDELILH
jgi:hypothetical protein